MSVGDKETWSGLDLEPLPYESSLSVLWRLGWRNAIGATQIAQICRDKSVFNPNVSFYTSNWIDSEYFADQTGWHLPQREEQSMTDVFDGMVDAWFSYTLRICPICVQDGYHSVWFQFHPLVRCPMHCCELLNSCQYCGAKLGSFFPSKNLLRRSYHCNFCSNPISGAPLLLQDHLKFREHRIELERAFQPMTQWLQDAPEKLKPLKRLCSLNSAWQSTWVQWCRPEDFIQSVCHALHPLPEMCSSPLYRKLTFIHWCARPGSKENINKYQLRAALRGRGGEATQIYRQVIQDLQRALSGRFRKIAVQRSVRLPEHCEPLNLRSRAPSELGYFLLRTKLERGEIMRPVDYAQLWNEPAIPLPWDVIGGLPKSALRAMYIAMYVNIVNSIIHARKCESAQLSSLDMRDQALVAHSWWQEGEAARGFFVFIPVNKIHFP